jgi:hypothetical protein
MWAGALLLAGAVGVQADIIVAPNANGGTNGGTGQFGIFGNGSGDNITFQWDVAASQLTSLVGEDITAIGFRLPGGASTVNTATTIGAFNLELSGSLNPLGSLNATPANNIAANAVTVYNNPSLVIPANSLVGGAGPNPFYVIDFTTPFLYTGGDLLITTDTTSSKAAIEVDAVNVNSVADTSACFGGSCQAEFYNSPVTELVGTPAVSGVPETSSVLLFGTVLAGALILFRHRVFAKS